MDNTGGLSQHQNRQGPGATPVPGDGMQYQVWSQASTSGAFGTSGPWPQAPVLHPNPNLNFFAEDRGYELHGYSMASQGLAQATIPYDNVGIGSTGPSAGNKTLYLGNLHPFITELLLHDLFAGCRGILELKIIKDKATGIPAGYGFAKFVDMTSAQEALDIVGKPVVFGQEVRVNWAFQKEQREELGTHVHVFVGDLGADVTDAMLSEAFEVYPGCSDSRVMWDHASGRSRGFGFVSFATRAEAETAIQGQHGQLIGSRRVRCGWAQHKTPDSGSAPVDPQALERADPTNTNVYVGNLDTSLSDAEVRHHFGAFGPLAEMKLHRKGAYGFVRYRNHEDAVRAIVGCNGQMLGSKVLKCSWGRHPSLPPSGLHSHLLLATGAGLNPMLPLGLAGPGPAPLGVSAGLAGLPPMIVAGAGGLGGALLAPYAPPVPATHYTPTLGGLAPEDPAPPRALLGLPAEAGAVAPHAPGTGGAMGLGGVVQAAGHDRARLGGSTPADPRIFPSLSEQASV